MPTTPDPWAPWLFDLLRLPRELVLHVGRFLPRKDLAALVWSSRHMRDLLAPDLYRYPDRSKVLVDATKSWKPQVMLQLIEKLKVDPRLSRQPLLHVAISSMSGYSNPQDGPVSLMKTLRLLVDKGICVDAVDPKYGRTALIQVVRDIGCEQMLPHVQTLVEHVVTFLLQEGAEKDAMDFNGRTALHYAARKGHRQMLNFLLQKGLSGDIYDNSGNAPIHLAIEGMLDSPLVCKAPNEEHVLNEDRFDVLRQLCAMSGGDRVNMKTKLEGYTPLHRAIKPETPYHVCSGQYVVYRAIVHVLLLSGADPNIPDFDGLTPLHMAVAKPGQVVTDKITTHCSTDLHRPTFNQLGDAPLHHAIRVVRCRCSSNYVVCPRVNSVRALLAAGANVDQQNRAGETALYLAVEFLGQCRLTIETLTNAGARVDIPDMLGETPVHIAAERDMKEVLQILRKGTNKDGTGLTGECTRARSDEIVGRADPRSGS